MHGCILIMAVVALVACSKDKTEQPPAGNPTARPAESKTPAPTAGGTRPATINDAQSKAYDKFAVEAEALGKDAAAAGADCAKLAAVASAHAAQLSAAQEAMIAAKIDTTDAAAKGWLAASYSGRMATAIAGYGAAAARCATDSAFAAAAASIKLGDDALGQAGLALDQAGVAMDQAGKAIDQATKGKDDDK